MTDQNGVQGTDSLEVQIEEAQVPEPVATPTPEPEQPTPTPEPEQPTATPAPEQPTPEPTPAPEPPQAVINGPTQGFVGDGLLFDGSYSQASSPIVSYEWDFGDGTTDNSGMGVGHSYSAPGSYTVSLTVTDQNGLTGSDSIVVQIEAQAAPQIEQPASEGAGGGG